MPRIIAETWTRRLGEQKRFLATELNQTFPRLYLSNLLPKELVNAIVGLLGNSTIEFKIKFQNIQPWRGPTQVFYLFDDLFITLGEANANTMHQQKQHHLHFRPDIKLQLGGNEPFSFSYRKASAHPTFGVVYGGGR